MASEMTDTPRLVAHAIARILSSRTQAIVGYLYEWNNGDRQPAWLGRPYKKVYYESLNEQGTGETSFDHGEFRTDER